jgi:Uma2 family endonuclease
MSYAECVALSPTTRRFTVKNYHRMGEADVFEPDDRVELVDGEVFELAPIGSRHAECVTNLSYVFWSRVGVRAKVRVQQPIQVGELSEPQPDVALVRTASYANHHPLPADVLLVIEVADTSLRHDLLRKAPLYIAGGVREAWVVDLGVGVLHVARSDSTFELRPGDSVSPEAFPDVVLEVAAILG